MLDLQLAQIVHNDFQIKNKPFISPSKQHTPMFNVLNNILLHRDPLEAIYRYVYILYHCNSNTHTVHTCIQTHSTLLWSQKTGISIICWKSDSHLVLCIKWRKGQCYNVLILLKQLWSPIRISHIHNTLCYCMVNCYKGKSKHQKFRKNDTVSNYWILWLLLGPNVTGSVKIGHVDT